MKQEEIWQWPSGLDCPYHVIYIFWKAWSAFKGSWERRKIMEFKGSKTEKNLLAAFAGESQARNRYTYFASAAKKEGYEQISAIFLETADNEKEHAKLFFKLLKGGEAEIIASYPAGVIGDSAANLKAAADGENFEWTTLYQNFADVAKKEGFMDAYETFTQIAKVEKFHEARYLSSVEKCERRKGLQKRLLR